MIYYKLTNISGGLLVCDLVTECKTLRLQHKQSAVVPESEMTDHLWNLIVNYLVLCSESHTTDEEFDGGNNSGGSSGGSISGNDRPSNDAQVSTRGAVRYDTEQTLSKDEKHTARKNVDAQETLIDYIPSVTLSNKTGLDSYYVLLENYDVYSTYLVRVSDKPYALEELEGLSVKKYNSETGFVSETIISSKDVNSLTQKGSMVHKDFLFVVVSKDEAVSVKGIDITFEGTYLLFEDYGSYALYLEVEIPEKLVFKDGVTKTINENSEDKTLPTAKAVFDFVQGQKFVKEETVNSLVEEVGKELDEKLTSDDLNRHNVDNTAHNDLRILIEQYVKSVQAILDSDDETLDQLSEIVAYIKSNKDLIDSITTSKVSVTDIIDNLETNLSNKPLSASMGVALKTLIENKDAVEYITDEEYESIMKEVGI